MSGTALVIGATGRIGGATLRSLVDAGKEPLAMVRTEKRAESLPDGVDFRIADLDDPAALAAAMEGVDALLLCSVHGPAMERQQLNAIEAAGPAGVRRVVKISASPASAFEGTPSEAAAEHLAVEASLAEAGVEHTSIRPNAFAQFLAGSAGAIADGVLPLPLGDAAVSWVDARDVGAVAAAALHTERSLPATIEVTGPEALGGAAVAELVSAQVGRPVVYRSLADAEAAEGLRAAGAPDWLADHVVTVFRLFRERDAGQVTNGVEEWVRRPATGMVDVLARDADVLGLKPAAA